MTVSNMRQSPSGRVAWLWEAFSSGALGNQAATSTTENSIAGATFLNDGSLIAAPRENLDNGLFFSHSGMRVSGSGIFALANSTAAPISVPVEAPIEFDGGPLVGALHRGSPSGLLSVARAGTVIIDPASAAANSNVNTAIDAAVPDATEGDVIVASPRAALEAGMVYSHTRVSNTAQGDIVLANITAGAVDQGSITFDYVLLKRTDAVGGRPRLSPSGPIVIQRLPISIDSGNIAAKTVVETTVSIAPAGGGIAAPNTAGNRFPVVSVFPNAALPAGLAISHARISAENVISVGLANVSAGAIDPAVIAMTATVFNMPTN